MSNHLISEVYKRQVGNIARKAVMVLLADKASDDGSGIWASKQRMADEIGATKQTVIATIKGLIADGLIREAGQRKSPNGYTVEYAINIPALRAVPLVKCHIEDQSEDLTGQADVPVKQLDATGQIPLPDRSEDLTQTPLNPPEPPKEDSPSDDEPSLLPEHVWEFYVQVARQFGRPVPRNFDADRRQLVRHRIAQNSVDDFRVVFANIRGSPFLRGDRDRCPLTFDWLFQPKNFRKVLEGNYNG